MIHRNTLEVEIPLQEVITTRKLGDELEAGLRVAADIT